MCIMRRRNASQRASSTEELTHMTPGQRIFQFRKQRYMSQVALASRMRKIATQYRGLGTDRWQVHRWENDTHEPDPYTRHILAQALGVQVTDLGLAPNPYFDSVGTQLALCGHAGPLGVDPTGFPTAGAIVLCLPDEDVAVVRVRVATPEEESRRAVPQIDVQRKSDIACGAAVESEFQR